ncbi:hypothetical protein, partial [Streptococcus pneumoniae]|uniref:hypothetical protein n=1 Tax=Streptococcus pneumoniae TaxID=1313 RepID=UPI00077BF37B
IPIAPSPSGVEIAAMVSNSRVIIMFPLINCSFLGIFQVSFQIVTNLDYFFNGCYLEIEKA